MVFINKDLSKVGEIARVQREAIILMLGELADLSYDGCALRNHQGFNREDLERGTELSQEDDLNQVDAEEGKWMLYKYHRQLSPSLWIRVFGMSFEDIQKRKALRNKP